MRRFAIRLGSTLVCATTGWILLPVPPAEAAPGFETALTRLPGRFVAGAGAETITAVISTNRDDGCRKVRWSLVLRADGLRLDQVGIDRIEQNGVVGMEVRGANGGARLTDRELDPGTLCRNRTVTAQYRLAVDAAVTDGRIELTVEAFDAQSRLLDAASATREVVSERSGGPASRRRAPTPSQQARPTPTEAVRPTEPVDGDAPVLAEGTDGAGAADGGSGGGEAAAADRGGAGLTLLGFGFGALLLFLGAGLLLRLHFRNRFPEPATATSPSRRSRPAVRRGNPEAVRRRDSAARHYSDW
ncbi:hypothetical protein O7626_08340 [Micromonospora sp. WMMD1102]|uniref:hypothetical protein n=1 Tax=Micromonospora sp. WMMD1102 TaxID=3016105 RepID=UPI0024154F45|nr:hypothetical protein [Micromonospora sp. WMMD1102]MDG4785934.1 hypothetical protein [Micromonospora sp. WMMD1102]